MPEISVIVPVYKAEKYLCRCVDSILAQTFRDFELILVDDGSPDRSGQLCDEYARKDPRIQVIHQKNGGAASARNTGLDWVEENSSSRWIAFADSDDWMHPEMLERLLSAAREFDVPISVCGYLETSTECPWEDREVPPAQLWEPADFYLERNVNATVPWGKLYRKECFSGERYVEGKHYDDEFLTYRLLYKAGQLAVISAPLYVYFINAEGLTKQKWDPKMLCVWDAYEQQIAFFASHQDAEIVRFRYQHYLGNARDSLDSAGSLTDKALRRRVVRDMSKRLRSVVYRGWKAGHIRLWRDRSLIFGTSVLRAKLYWLKLRLEGREGYENA